MYWCSCSMLCHICSVRWFCTFSLWGIYDPQIPRGITDFPAVILGFQLCNLQAQLGSWLAESAQILLFCLVLLLLLGSEDSRLHHMVGAVNGDTLLPFYVPGFDRCPVLLDLLGSLSWICMMHIIVGCFYIMETCSIVCLGEPCSCLKGKLEYTSRFITKLKSYFAAHQHVVIYALGYFAALYLYRSQMGSALWT